MGMTRVIVPLDGSPESEAAFAACSRGSPTATRSCS